MKDIKVVVGSSSCWDAGSGSSRNTGTAAGDDASDPAADDDAATGSSWGSLIATMHCDAFSDDYGVEIKIQTLISS